MEAMNMILGVIGLLIASASIWVKNERKQDLGFLIGGVFLLLYSASIHSYVFVILQVVFMISSGLELFGLSRKRK